MMHRWLLRLWRRAYHVRGLQWILPQPPLGAFGENVLTAFFNYKAWVWCVEHPDPNVWWIGQYVATPETWVPLEAPEAD